LGRKGLKVNIKNDLLWDTMCKDLQGGEKFNSDPMAKRRKGISRHHGEEGSAGREKKKEGRG